jgi:trans-2,3-dihydro-3-hydroxyanthranilate isomerase
MAGARVAKRRRVRSGWTWPAQENEDNEFEPLIIACCATPRVAPRVRLGKPVSAHRTLAYNRPPLSDSRCRPRRRSLMNLSFRIVNVFTLDGQALSGNPLAVVEDATALTPETMQAIALQFNLSETTFLLPSPLATAQVRIFTPHYEMPFAGHPTLGSAHVVRSLNPSVGDTLTLSMLAGVIPVRAEGDHWTLSANAAATREVSEPVESLAAALGLHPDDIGCRPLWVSTGREQLIVPLTSAAAVRRAAPRAALLTALESAQGNSMAYVFAERGDGGFLSRFFFPAGTSLKEDPATGSAAANLGGWLLAMGRAGPLQFHIEQGEATGRPSRLGLAITATNAIEVTGEVIEFARGTLHVPA